MNKKFLALLFFLLLSVSLSAAPIQPQPKVKVQGRQLLVRNDAGQYDPFYVNGIGYQPMPVGRHPSDWGYPLGVKRTANIYDDPLILQRDFSLITGMNVNTLRIWKGDNTTLPDGRFPNKLTKGFLDTAQTNGIKVIAGFWVDPVGEINCGNQSSKVSSYVQKINIKDTKVRKDYVDRFKAYVTEFKDHPAILFWAIGNGNNIGLNSQDMTQVKAWYSLVNEMALAAKTIEGAAAHPVAVVNADLQYIGDSNAGASDQQLTGISIWGVNLYRGSDFNDTFNQYAAKSTKPIWISEYGADAWLVLDARIPADGREDQAGQADKISSMTDNIIANRDVSIGGTLLGFSDEYWKPYEFECGSTSAVCNKAHDYYGHEPVNLKCQEYWNIKPTTVTDSYLYDEWMGVLAVTPAGDNAADQLTARQSYYVLQSKFATTTAAQSMTTDSSMMMAMASPSGTATRTGTSTGTRTGTATGTSTGTRTGTGTGSGTRTGTGTGTCNSPYSIDVDGNCTCTWNCCSNNDCAPGEVCNMTTLECAPTGTNTSTSTSTATGSGTRTGTATGTRTGTSTGTRTGTNTSTGTGCVEGAYCDDGNGCTVHEVCSGGSCGGGDPWDCRQACQVCVNENNLPRCDFVETCTGTGTQTGTATGTASCGNGVVDSGESCDGSDTPCQDGTVSTGGICLVCMCENACGDGTIDTGAGEDCESNSDCASGQTCSSCHCSTGTNTGSGTRTGTATGTRTGTRTGTNTSTGTGCADGTACDDGNACTQNICSNGTCSNPAITCSDGNVCTADLCDSAAGCFYPEKCEEDGDLCTANCDATTGHCDYQPVTCEDYNSCTTNMCDSVSGCFYPEKCEEDGDLCTVNCTAATGECEYQPMTCEDYNSCTTNMCDSVSGCFYPEKCEEDGDLCTANCNATTGDCDYQPMTCEDNHSCTIDSCVSGSCQFNDIPDCCETDPDCLDGDICTTNSCDNGTCDATPVQGCCDADEDCTDNDSCSANFCENNVCTSEPIECAEGKICIGGVCQCDDDSHCDDEVVCTEDSCVDGACENIPNNSSSVALVLDQCPYDSPIAQYVAMFGNETSLSISATATIGKSVESDCKITITANFSELTGYTNSAQQSTTCTGENTCGLNITVTKDHIRDEVAGNIIVNTSTENCCLATDSDQKTIEIKPNPKRVLHEFKGFPDNWSSGSAINSKLIGSEYGIDEIVQYDLSTGAYKDIAEFAKKNVLIEDYAGNDPKCKMYRTVNMYGWSWGGHTALYMAKRLAEEQGNEPIQVDKMFLVDPIPRGGCADTFLSYKRPYCYFAGRQCVGEMYSNYQQATPAFGGAQGRKVNSGTSEKLCGEFTVSSVPTIIPPGGTFFAYTQAHIEITTMKNRRTIDKFKEMFSKDMNVVRGNYICANPAPIDTEMSPNSKGLKNCSLEFGINGPCYYGGVPGPNPCNGLNCGNSNGSACDVNDGQCISCPNVCDDPTDMVWPNTEPNCYGCCAKESAEAKYGPGCTYTCGCEFSCPN